MLGLFVHGYGMDCTYLGHSAFLLETENVYLLFDYTKGSLELPSVGKPLVVFASHRHGDHFSTEIFGLAKRKGRTTFVLSSDIATHHAAGLESVVWLGPYEEAEVENVAIRTLKSTDEGVAFILDMDGKAVYFAGDLNHWHWNGESEEYNRQMEEDYHQELRLLPRSLDVAFIPVDPRLEDAYILGAKDLLERISVTHLVPMHLWGAYELCARLAQELKEQNLTTAVALLHTEPQTWRIE